MSTISSITPGSILYACGISIVCSVTLMSVAMGTVHWLEIDQGLGYHIMECGLFKCCSGGNCIDFDELELTDYDYAVFVIAGSSNFVAKANDSSCALHSAPGWNIGYSFFLASATGVISILTGVLCFLGSNRLLKNQQSQHIVFQQPPNPHPGLGVHAGTHPYNPMVNPHQAGMMAPPPPPLPPPQGYGTNQPNMAVQGNQYPQYEYGTK